MDIKIEVDKIFASLGEELSYRVILTNQRSVPLEDIWLIDKLPLGIEFVKGSIEVGGCPAEGMINQGISLDTLLEGEIRHITFKCVVNQLPKLNPIIHTVDVGFIENMGELREEMISNAVVTVVTDPNIGEEAGTFELSVDKEEVSYGGILSYTIRLVNQGNCKAKHLWLRNLVPIQTSIRSESLKGIKRGVLDEKGKTIYIESLEIGEEITLSYEVIIQQEIIQYEIPHQVMLEYEFVGADRKKVYKKYLSQKVCSTICLASFNKSLKGFIKTTNNCLYTVGDEILYNLKLTNIGNVTATHMRLVDKMPKGIEFILQSLVVDGLEYDEKVSIEEGIILPDIKSHERVEIFYKGRVKEAALYEDNLTSHADITYDYIVGEDFVRGEECSNTPAVTVGIGLINEDVFQLISDLQIATLGDEITYHMKLENKGNMSLSLINLVLDKPKGMSIIEDGWEEREGKAYLKYLPDLKAGEVIDISYSLVIQDLKAIGRTEIECMLGYNYLVGDRLIEKKLHRKQKGSLGVVIANLQKEDGGIVKSVDQKYIILGETLSYTTVLTNTGNITAQDVKLKHILSGWSKDYEERTIEVGDIMPKEAKSITYQCLIHKLPELGYIRSRDRAEYTYVVDHQRLQGVGESEEVITIAEEADLLEEDGMIRQRADKKIVKPNDIITYTLELTNRGNVPAKELTVTLPKLEEGEWIGKETILLEQIEVGEVCSLTYKLKVNSYSQGEEIVCNPRIKYVFDTSRGVKKQRSYEVLSIITPIHRAKLITPIGHMMGVADKEYATLGDEVTCRIQLWNEGNLTAKDVLIRPIRVEGILFAEETEEPLIYLGDIEPKESIEVSYTIGIAEYVEQLLLLSELSYTYSVEEEWEEVTIRETIRSSPVNIRFARLTLNKWVDKLCIIAKEKISYKLACKNEGNVDAVKVRLEQYLPEGMHLCQETVRVDKACRFSLLDKQTIMIEKISPGEEVEVAFQVEVSADIKGEEAIESTSLAYEVQIDPSMNPRQMCLLPIETKFQVISPKIEVRLIGEQKIGLIGEILPYKIEITNKGNIDLQDILVSMEMTEGIESACHALDGMSILRLAREEVKVLDVEIYIASRKESGKAVLSTCVTYAYNLEGDIRTGIEKTEAITLRIEEIQLEISKKTDKDLTRVGIGDEIHYHIQIVNVGTIPINQLILYDELGDNIHLIEGSLRANDLPLSTAPMAYGINLGEMKVGKSLILDYKVRVEGYYCKFIRSKIYVEYITKRGDSNHYIKGQTPTKNHEIRMIAPCLTTLSYRNTLTLPYEYGDIYRILDFKAETLIINQRVESLHSSLIQGQLKYKIIYINSSKVKQSVEWTKVFVEKIGGIVSVSEGESILQATIDKESIDIINNRQMESRVEVGIRED